MIQPTNMQTPYPQQGGANAVSINIFNPQAYGGTNATNAPAMQNNPYATNTMAMQPNAPYTYNSMYQMPEVSAYPAFQPSQNMMYPQYAPIQNYMTSPFNSQVIAPTPQAMPESVLNQVQTEAQAIDNTTQAVDSTAQATNAQTAETQTPVEVVEPQQVAQTIDVDTLVQNLKSADANVKAETINQIATYAQDSPEIALQIVSEPIMQSLVNVINEDTTALEGPTPEQIAVAEKIAKGEQLTPEEDALAEQLSPRDMANKNRIFALYTLAMIQKLQRDELNQYIEAQKADGQQTIEPLKVEDLVGYNDVINTIKNDARPEVKVAAIQALQHVVEPQDKATVEPVLTEAQASQDEAVKTAAAEAMAKFAA